ncbi:YiiX family permuted papain-like enzyme [Halocola ammonii]
MKSISTVLLALFISATLTVCSPAGSTSPDRGKVVPWQNGDIIFQSGSSDFSQAIKLATKSEYSHMGILFEKDGEWFVFEAVQPVRATPIEDWIDRGVGDKFIVKRLRNANQILTSEVLAEMRKIGAAQIGKNYDSAFNWSDEEMYCSELVWKIYRRAANIEIGEPKPLKTYDLSHELVKLQLNKIHGSDWPLDEPMISPQAMFKSELIETITN